MKNPKSKENNKKEEVVRGVVHLSQLPHGFYEEQMRSYFSQFGKVRRIRVARSRKTLKSKGYSYIEFEDEEVGKIAAESMNNYLMFDRLIKSRYISPDKVHPNLFFRPQKVGKLVSTRTKAICQQNSVETPENHVKMVQRMIEKLEKKKLNLKGLGIPFVFEVPEYPKKVVDNNEDFKNTEAEVHKKSNGTKKKEKKLNSVKKSMAEHEKSKEMEVKKISSEDSMPATKSQKKKRKRKSNSSNVADSSINKSTIENKNSKATKTPDKLTLTEKVNDSLLQATNSQKRKRKFNSSNIVEPKVDESTTKNENSKGMKTPVKRTSTENFDDSLMPATRSQKKKKKLNSSNVADSSINKSTIENKNAKAMKTPDKLTLTEKVNNSLLQATNSQKKKNKFNSSNIVEPKVDKSATKNEKSKGMKTPVKLTSTENVHDSLMPATRSQKKKNKFNSSNIVEPRGDENMPSAEKQNKIEKTPKNETVIKVGNSSKSTKSQKKKGKLNSDGVKPFVMELHSSDEEISFKTPPNAIKKRLNENEERAKSLKSNLKRRSIVKKRKRLSA